MSGDDEPEVNGGTVSAGTDAERRDEELRRPASLSSDKTVAEGEDKTNGDDGSPARAEDGKPANGRKTREEIESLYRDNPVFATVFDKTPKKKKIGSSVLITVGGVRLTAKRLLILFGFFLVVLACLAACLVYAFADLGKIRDYSRAVALLEDGDYEGARTMFIRVLSADPNKEDALVALADIYNRFGDWNNETFFRRRLMRVNPLKTEYFHDFMESAFRARNFSVIYSHLQLKDAKDLTPDEGALYLIAALCSGHVPEGKSFYAEQVKQKPDYFSASERGRFAELLLNTTEMDGTRVGDYAAFLKDAKDPQIRFETICAMLGYYTRQNDAESEAETEKLLREAAELNNFAGVPLLANFYFSRFRFDDAIAVCEDFLKTKMNASIPILLGESYVLGNYSDRIPPLADKVRAMGGRQSNMLASYLDALYAFSKGDSEHVWSNMQAAGGSIETPLSALMKLQVALYTGSRKEIIKALNTIMNDRSFLDFRQRARTAALEYLMSVPDADILSDAALLNDCAEIASLIQTRGDDVSFLRRIIVLNRFNRNLLQDDELQDALRTFPNDIVFLRIASEYYLNNGQPERAAEYIAEYNSLPIPNKPSVAVLHIRALTRLGRNDEAEKEFRTLLENGGEDSLLYPYYELCVENDFLDALKSLANRLESLPQKSSKRSALPFVRAEILLAEGKKDQALDLFAKSAANDPRFVFHAASRLAEHGRTDAAISRYLAIRDASPDKVRLNVSLSELYSAKGDAKSALECVKTAWQLNPGDLQARKIYAGFLVKAGQYAEAVKVLDFPQRRMDFPEDMLSIWREAMLKTLKSDFDAARYIPALEKAKQLQVYFPDDRDAQEYIRKIDEARRQERQDRREGNK